MMRRFDVGKMRREIENLQREKTNKPSLCGVPLRDVRIHLLDGDVLEGRIERISRYEMLLNTSEGQKLVIFKHSILFIDTEIQDD